MKKLNNKQKEKIVYVVTAVIIVSILIVVIANLSTVKASATDNTVVNVYNSTFEVSFEEVENVVPDESVNNPAGNIDHFEVGDIYYNTEPYMTDSYLYIPDFYVQKQHYGTDEFTSLGYYNFYIIFILRSTWTEPINVAIRGQARSADNSSATFDQQTEMQNCLIGTDYTLICFKVTDYEHSNGENRPYYKMRWNIPGIPYMECAGYVLGYDIGNVARQAIKIMDFKNANLNPPINVVYGTDQIVKTLYSTHTNYKPQDLMIPWNNFYLGFICSTVIDGTTVDLLWSVAYEDMQYGHGTFVILDDEYHDYILDIDLDGAVTYGQIELDIENTNEFDVKYIAVSDNYDVLSADLVVKVNEYNQIGDSESYNAGYADGYAAGIKQGSIGPFANAKMMVEFSIKEIATNIVTESVMEFPFVVNAGGISFENVWYWYNNSGFNDSAYSVQAVNISIYLTKPLLWKNTLFYFGNDSNSETFLPLSVSVRNAGTSGNTLYTAALDQIGDYFYVTLDNVEYLSIEAIEFTVTNANASYADIFVTNKLTLYSDINQVIVDEMSYNLGEEAGYKNGYDNGFSQGELQAQTVAFSEGREAGFADGRTVGYNEGYEQGLQDDFRFYDLFFSLFDAQLNTFKSVVSFEIFGINVAGFVLGLVTIGIVAFVIRKVW